MGKKLGWFEIIANDERVPNGVGIGIFSTKWRTEPDPDCYYPDICLYLAQEKKEGFWYIAHMDLTNPEVEEFADLAILVLKEIKGKDFTTISNLTKHLNRFLDDKIPQFA